MVLKINVESVIEASEPIQLFYSGCKSPATKDKYTQSLKRVIFEFMEEILTGDTFESRANEIVTRAREDPKWITSVLIAIVDGLKKKTDHELSWHEQTIKATLEQWIDDLQKNINYLHT